MLLDYHNANKNINLFDPIRQMSKNRIDNRLE